MDAATFLENFGHLADAPNGVDRLRKMVLDLAVRGKLVKHHSGDESADLLIQYCIDTSNRMEKSKEIRKQAELPPVEDSEKPFSIPDLWSWTRLGRIGQIIGGGTPRTSDSDSFSVGGIPWLTPADLSDFGGKWISKGRRDLSEEGLGRCSAQLMPAGTVLFSSRAPIGHLALAANEIATNQGFKSIIPYVMELNEYIYVFLMHAREEIDRNASGTTFKEVSGAIVKQIAIPLPPLAEQKRIVAKVDELMALCDELKARQQEHRTVHVSLNKAALDSLTTAGNDDDFTAAWTRVRTNFDTLYSIPENVTALRQTILQLAVMGKLVEQDPNDEPTENLLSRVFAEKRELEDSGRIKKQAATRPVGNSEVLFRIPSNWRWVRAAEVCYPISSGSTPKKSVFQADTEGGVPYLKVYNIRNQEIDFEYKPQFINEEHHSLKMKRSILLPGMVVLNIVGPPLGKTAIIPDTYPEWNCNQAIAFFRLIGDILPQFVHLFFRDGSFLRNIALIGTAGQDNISVTKCKNIVLPIPPFREQIRIIEKVDQLMALCDELEARLTQQKYDAGRLTEAMIAGVLEGANT